MWSWLGRQKDDTPLDWRDTDLFETLEPEERDALAERIERHELEAGEVVVAEEEPAGSLFVLGSGRASVSKREKSGGEEYIIGSVERGEIVGELGVFDRLPREATVRMEEPGVVWGLPLRELRPGERPKGDGPLSSAYTKLVRNMGSVVSSRLRAQTDQSLALVKRRAVMGDFVVKVLILLCVYVFLVEGLQHLRGRQPADTYYVDIPLQLFFGAASWWFIRGTGYPLRQFGIGFRELFGSLVEGLLFTIPVLALMTGAKWLFQAPPLFRQPDVLALFGDPATAAPVLIYALSCVVQELIVRGALQSSLEAWLVGPRRRLYAIVVPALLFGVTHLHVGFVFAAATLLPGLFWGWLFSRKKNLIGVTLSHIAIGGYAFFVLGVIL